MCEILERNDLSSLPHLPFFVLVLGTQVESSLSLFPIPFIRVYPFDRFSFSQFVTLNALFFLLILEGIALERSCFLSFTTHLPFFSFQTRPQAPHVRSRLALDLCLLSVPHQYAFKRCFFFRFFFIRPFPHPFLQSAIFLTVSRETTNFSIVSAPPSLPSYFTPRGILKKQKTRSANQTDLLLLLKYPYAFSGLSLSLHRLLLLER